jgi:hypothetical protein
MNNKTHGATSTEDMHDGSFGVFIHTTSNGLPSGTRKLQVCSITETEEHGDGRPDGAPWPPASATDRDLQARSVASQLAKILGYTYLSNTEPKVSISNWLQEIFDSKVVDNEN